MNAPDFHIVIPARMASERLPGKPLADIAGKPLIRHVHERALAADAASVCIATDDVGIASAARAFGADVVMTDADHQSGTDRIAECAAHRGWPDAAVVVNLQGDEPLMPADCLNQVAGLLAADPAADAASLWWPLESAVDICDPNIVKVITASDGAALYFSRSVLPYPRAWSDVPTALRDGATWKRHVGLYAYRVRALRQFAAQPRSSLERSERLEQLRVLESGGRIAMAQACQPIPAGVDTPADLERLRQLIAE